MKLFVVALLIAAVRILENFILFVWNLSKIILRLQLNTSSKLVKISLLPEKNVLLNSVFHQVLSLNIKSVSSNQKELHLVTCNVFSQDLACSIQPKVLTLNTTWLNWAKDKPSKMLSSVASTIQELTLVSGLIVRSRASAKMGFCQKDINLQIFSILYFVTTYHIIKTRMILQFFLLFFGFIEAQLCMSCAFVVAR